MVYIEHGVMMRLEYGGSLVYINGVMIRLEYGGSQGVFTALTGGFATRSNAALVCPPSFGPPDMRHMLQGRVPPISDH
jgi:hypothetical protein